ncbi:hypothetical protein RUND412_003421 [Rhizina undulata]
MTNGRLSNDEFFAQLTTLLQSTTSQQKGSIFLTQKPLTPESYTHAVNSPPPTDAAPIPLLIRATNGKKRKSEIVKLSTLVQPADLEAFFARYAEVCKANMGALKKRDRKARKTKARKKNKAKE